MVVFAGPLGGPCVACVPGNAAPASAPLDPRSSLQYLSISCCPVNSVLLALFTLASDEQIAYVLQASTRTPMEVWRAQTARDLARRLRRLRRQLCVCVSPATQTWRTFIRYASPACQAPGKL
jgi:hypothetical protein